MIHYSSTIVPTFDGSRLSDVSLALNPLLDGSKLNLAEVEASRRKESLLKPTFDLTFAKVRPRLRPAQNQGRVKTRLEFGSD